MTTITALPTAPSRADPTNFATRADAWISQFTNTTVTEINTVAGEVNTNAASAAASASTATTQAGNAATSATAASNSATAAAASVATVAALWVSGTTYALGTLVYSPINFATYRKKTSTAGGTVDPSINTTDWTSPVVTVGAGGQTTTGSLTLTASSAAAITVTPATPGLYVTLPDATTCNKADNLFSVYNTGDYDYGVKDSAGTQLGWIRARTGAMIGLADNSTAAGVWAYYGLEKTGITASYVNSTLANMGNTIRRVALDANRTCFLFGGASCYAIIYDASTQTWGSATLVRASVGSGAFLGVLSATNQVLVVSNDSTTAMEAVTLTIATNTVTVNTGTKGTATLGGNWASFGQLIAVGSSWVVSYSRASTTPAIRAITVSGTTPTIGGEQTIAGVAQDGAPKLFASGSVVRTVTVVSGNVQATPFTVSGSTLTLGSAVLVTGAAPVRAFLNGNGNIVCQYLNTTLFATIFKLTGTVEAASSVSVGTATTNISTYNDIGVISASKTLFTGVGSGATWYANILTDTNGTATAGTEISGILEGNATPGIPVFNVTGTNAYVAAATTTHSTVLTLNCSGTSPTLTSLVSVQGGNTSSGASFLLSSDKYGVKHQRQLYAGTCATTVGNYSDGTVVNCFDMRYSQNGIFRVAPLPIHSMFLNYTGVCGATNSESWINQYYHSSGIGQVIQRVEAAA